MKPSLGKLEKVDLRQVWKHEAYDFTNWLALPENLDLLADKIGLELELDEVEKNVGTFSADIVCKVVGRDDHWVLIENQLAKTDHTHLGQIITYAAGLDAVTIVWIAERFTDEHRAALDWLNENTNDKINLFGIEIELWRIGESHTAPHFKIVSQPNDWTKTISKAARGLQSGEVSELKQKQLAYWDALFQKMKSDKHPIRPQKPLPQHWANFAIGRANVWMNATVNGRENWISVSLSTGGILSKESFAALLAQKEAIERELGTALEWQELPDRKEARIRLRLSDTDFRDEKNWPRQHQWIAEWLEKFNKVFRARVKNLNTTGRLSEEDAA